MLRKYASWGLDFIKVDCISDHPYRPTEIRQIAAGHSEDRAANCAQPFARPHLARSRRGSRQIRADVAHRRRSLGQLD